jgi:WD40 repeat protein
MAVRTRDDRVAPVTSRDKATVFVSYAREDETIVERLGSALRANGREVWIDTDDIRGTEEWERAIDAGIDSSDAVAFVLSPAFLGSEQCRREHEYAVQKGKRLVPLLAREVDPADVPPELARLNWISIGDVDPAAVAALEEALDTDLDWVRTHTDLLVRAAAWEARNEDRGLLLRGRPLADAERFLASASGKEPPPSPLHVRYVLAGRRAATRRQRGTIGVVTTFLLVAVGLAVLALLQRNRAIHESNLATSRELAGSSIAVANSDPELARLLAVEAMDRAQTPEAVAALRRAVAQPALRLHTEPRTTVASLSPDGGRVALRRPDDTLDVLDLASGRRVASRLEGAGASARVAFATGGRRLAATTATGDAVLWDLQQRHRRRVEGQFATLAFSPDGSKVLLVERAGPVAVVDARSGERRVTLPANAGESSPFPGVPTAAFAPRGDLVLTWNDDSPEAQVWDARTGALRSTLRHGANITDADISPDGGLALTAGRDMTVRFWDPAAGAQEGSDITVPPADDDSFDVDIAAASFSPQSSAVVTTLTQDHLQVWRTHDAKLQLNLPNRFDYLIDQGFGPKAPYLLTGSDIHDWVHDRKVLEPPMRVALVHADGSFESVEPLGDQSTRVWSGQTESALFDLEHRASDVSAAGGRVAIGYADGTAEVRDAQGGRTLLRVPRESAEPVRVELSSDGRTLAVSRAVDANGEGGVELWRVGRGERRSLDASVTAAVGFSADGTRLLVFTNTGAGRFAVIDTRTGGSIGKTFPPRTVLIDSTALSPDGRLFVQATAENTIDVYRIEDGRRVGRPLSGHTNSAADVAVSPDNKLVASGGFDGLAIVWDLDSGRQVATLAAHEAAVAQVGFSPDGRLLLTRSTDGTLRVWEARTGAPVATWSGLPKGLPGPAEVDAPPVPDLGLDFSATGDELLRADGDYVYRIPCPACAEPDELLARAKMDIRRSLTNAERLQYLHEGE